MACPRLHMHVIRRAVNLRDFRLPSFCSAPAPGTSRCRWTHASASSPKYETLPTSQRQQVDAFLDELMDWNTRMNLTGARRQGSCWRAATAALRPPPAVLHPLR